MIVASKWNAWRAIEQTGVLLIVRLPSADEALKVAHAAIAGGIRALEIPLAVPDALSVIKQLSREYAGDEIVVGAGTVLDAQSAFACIQAGSQLLVSPNLNPDMLAVANRYQALSVSGAFTPTEIVNTLAAGADIVKLFPTSLGPDYVKTVREPLPQAPILPSGGATPENVSEWFNSGVTGVGVGSSITKAAVPDGDYQRVTTAAQDFLAAIAATRPTH